MGFNQILVELHGVFGDDRVIADSAWTSSFSNKKKEIKTEADVERVVKMLGNSKPPHGVPFESVIFRFWIRMPISTDRQFMTHRLQSANGMSGRYRTMPQDFYALPTDVLNVLEREGYLHLNQQFDQICTQANSWYRDSVASARSLMDAGQITNDEFKRLREMFRNALPQGNMTERTTTINLRSFANFQKQRNDGHAAPEMQYLAQRMLEEVEASNTIPIALEVLKNNGWIV